MTKNYLQLIRKLDYCQEALGISFCGEAACLSFLPDQAHFIGSGEGLLFCHVDGYQDTVFAVREKPESGLRVCPLAYDFYEFLRLCASYGSALDAANAGFRLLSGRNVISCSGNERQRRSMRKLADVLELTPIVKPDQYLKTIIQVIDCSHIRL